MCDKIIKLRKEKGLSQKQVAEYLHVDRSTYAYYESGHTKIGLDILIDLSQLYGMRLAFFLDYSPPDPAQIYPAAPPDANELEMLFNELSGKEQMLVLCYRGTDNAGREAMMEKAEGFYRPTPPAPPLPHPSA